MNLRKLYELWDDSDRPRTVNDVVNFLQQSGINSDQITSAFKKMKYNIHIPEDKKTEEKVEQNSVKSDAPKKLEPNPNKEKSASNTSEIPVGFTVDYENTTFTWKGASWVANGRLAKKELKPILNDLAQEKLKSEDAPKPETKIKSTVKGLEVGTKMLGPDGVEYRWRGAAWVNPQNRIAKKAIAAYLNDQISSEKESAPPTEVVNKQTTKPSNNEPVSLGSNIEDIYNKIRHIPNAIDLLQSTDPMAPLALAILASNKSKNIIDALERNK